MLNNIPEEVTAVNVDCNGDTILEAHCPDGKTRLLVSSHCLALASPVFNRMFNSQFNEGISNRSTSGNPSLISLSEDDAEALTLLCKVIHHQMDDVPRNPSLTCLKNLAIICDKYDCISIFAAWGELWIKPHIELPAAKDFNELMFVAYVLDLPGAFSRISWEILEAQVGPF